MRHRREHSLAGVVVGVAAGVLTLTFPTLGWLIVLAFLVVLIRARPRLPPIGGLSIGLGATWLTLLMRSYLACQRFDAAPNQECGQPDLRPWLLAAGVVLGAGIVVLVIAWRRGEALSRR